MEGKSEDMAIAGEEEVEYESDPEEAKLSLTMRRREASDDEEEADGDERKRKENPPRRIDSRGGIEPDRESDSEGAAADYDDEESEIDEEFEEAEEEVVEGEEDEVVEEEYTERGGKDSRGAHSDSEATEAAGGARVMDKELDEDKGRSVLESGEVEELHPLEEEKKENEPFAVPTAGAFYMHDDRFRDNAGGQHRRTLGRRKLWESKDDRKWGHDKFEEMTLQETHYGDMKERRNSGGRYRAHGKNRGSDRGYSRGNKSRAYNNSTQNYGPKSVRGRGPRRYDPSANNNIKAPPTQNKQPVKSIVKASHTSGRLPTATANTESDPLPVRLQVFASSLNSASLPFYPSGSSNKEIPVAKKRDVQTGAINRNLRPVVMDESYSMSQSASALRGKNLAASVGIKKLYVDDSISLVAGKPTTSLKTFLSESLLVNNSLHSRAQGRGLAPEGQMTFPPEMPLHQVNGASPPTQLHAVQQSAVQGQVHPALPASRHQLGEGPGGGSQNSSPPKASELVNSFESGEVESSSESNKSKSALVGRGRGSLQGSGKGPFIYGGAQVIGASRKMGGQGDKNFAATPAFLPVMPFGSQHPGGIGVPAVGMAFPGYVAQPQLGLGNSEMTWLPILGGAAGALGATYRPPYIAVDGAYHCRQTGQTSSSVAPSKESNTNKSSNEWKPSQRTEIGNDEFGQRQKNTRRYTTMNFGQ